ncbi:hypothetical protein [Bradyrhizobium sp. RT9b]|uniref:hypothetical protein n=1 Tax=Bradyrhizobium sp. RT9b TaxID=3156385 RepID=UPI0033956173
MAFSGSAAYAEITEQAVSATASSIRVKTCMRTSVAVGRALPGFIGKRGPADHEPLFGAVDDGVEDNDKGGEHNDSIRYPGRIEDGLGLRSRIDWARPEKG